MSFVELNLRSLPGFSSSAGVLSKVDVPGNKPRSFSRVFSRSRSYASSYTFDINEYSTRASSQVNYKSFYSYFGSYKLRKFSRNLAISFSHRIIHSKFDEYTYYFHRVKPIRNGALLIARSFGNLGATALFYPRSKSRKLRRRGPKTFSSRWKRNRLLARLLLFTTWFSLFSGTSFFFPIEKKGFFKFFRKRSFKIKKIRRFFLFSLASLQVFNFNRLFFTGFKYHYLDSFGFRAQRTSYVGKRGNPFIKF